MRVHNARRRALQRASVGTHTLAVSLHPRTRDPIHRHTQLLRTSLVNLVKRFPLRSILRDDPLPRAAVRNVPLCREGVEQLLAADAQARFEALRAVVDACVDDLGVARAGFCADCVVPLYEDCG